MLEGRGDTDGEACLRIRALDAVLLDELRYLQPVPLENVAQRPVLRIRTGSEVAARQREEKRVGTRSIAPCPRPTCVMSFPHAVSYSPALM